MTPYYTDDWLTVYGGDARTVLAELRAESVQMVCTSPPYWGLRDYGTAAWSGGDMACDHVPPNARMAHERRASTLGGGVATVAAQDAEARVRPTCGRCGATRTDSQLGLEPTPEEYVANMVGVFREVRRVLRPDGTLWLNLGDSYANTGGMTGGTNSKENGKRADRMFTGAYRPLSTGLKQKDLVGIPWRVAFALQADGWYLRSDIIWAKPNPMPESVTDRPTKSHEYLFLMSKSARYVYDAAAVAEGLTDSSIERLSQSGLDDQEGSWRVPGKTNGPMKAVGHLSPHMVGTDRNDGDRWRVEDGGVAARGTRNLRTVWTVATAPYPGAHFATFPPKLVEPCIKAGCPEGGVVLDPFAGTGTVGMVAQRLSRRAVLIDLNPDYLRQQLVRNAQTPLGLVG